MVKGLSGLQVIKLDLTRAYRPRLADIDSMSRIYSRLSKE